MASQIKILDERDVVHHPRPNQPVIMRAVTYQEGMGVPRVVYIPREEYSDERLRREIAADRERAKTDGARVIDL
jgi:hypothetical protein